MTTLSTESAAYDDVLTRYQPVFAVFIALGVLTAAGAAFALRPAPDRSTPKEDRTS